MWQICAKTVLKPVKQWEQLENMQNLLQKTFLNKNYPNLFDPGNAYPASFRFSLSFWVDWFVFGTENLWPTLLMIDHQYIHKWRCDLQLKSAEETNKSESDPRTCFRYDHSIKNGRIFRYDHSIKNGRTFSPNLPAFCVHQKWSPHNGTQKLWCHFTCCWASPWESESTWIRSLCCSEEKRCAGPTI